METDASAVWTVISFGVIVLSGYYAKKPLEQYFQFVESWGKTVKLLNVDDEMLIHSHSNVCQTAENFLVALATETLQTEYVGVQFSHTRKGWVEKAWREAKANFEEAFDLFKSFGLIQNLEYGYFYDHARVDKFACHPKITQVRVVWLYDKTWKIAWWQGALLIEEEVTGAVSAPEALGFLIFRQDGKVRFNLQADNT